MKKIILILGILFIGIASCNAAENVMYNVKSHIYHKPGCEWARKCTVNCKMISKDKARQIGRPCKVCGG